ncbi:Flp pilus assembly complex ATPase component TadA [Candidatus Woesearchaeota archaeon]|jgi:type IV pilus assembly protein PilB|nr:Flp pilus assembly complex ATPase component TadA [Candidatus Woesearchaeota archaeon]
MKLGIPIEAAKQIASFLVGYGLITDEQLSHATISSNEGGKGLIDTIIEHNFTSEKLIVNALSETYELDYINLLDDKIVDSSVISILPKKFICENRVIPIRDKGGTLDVVISEPSALNIMASIRLLTDKKIHAYITTFSQVDEFLANLNDIPLTQNEKDRESIVEEEVSQNQARSSIVIDFVDKALKRAIKLGVSDVHLEIYKKFGRMRFRLDGVLIDQKDQDKDLFENYAAIVTRIKIMSKLDIAERRLPQDGAMSLQAGKKEVDFRVSVLPTSFGERVVMRILDTSSISLTIETLGFLEEDEQAFKDAVDAPQGMVLVTGPTGSGKSTTLYAALGRINKDDINILTAEDPVEFTIDGVGQVHVKEDIGLTFSAALRSFLRQDPEVVMVGEIRDKETADIAIKSALTGHLVLSTLHTNDAISTITRLINMGLAPYLITSSLTLIVAQRLARKVCEACKTKDESVTQGQLMSIGFTPEEASRTQLCYGKGCSKCNKTGYKGRKGVYEVLRVTDNIKQGVLNGLTTPELLKIAKEKDYFSTMQEVGRGFLLEGSISLKEYQRILMSE